MKEQQNVYNNQIVKPKKKAINPKQTMNMYPGSMPQNMMISGNATGMNSSHIPQMKHNSSNQSMHSQKKMGNISTIRKPGADLHGGMSIH